MKKERELLLQQKRQLQQQEEVGKKPIQTTKKVEFKETPEIPSSVKETESQDRKTQREQELERKEAYLKELEEELYKKEESLRVKIAENPSAKSEVKKVDITHFSKPFINTFSGTDPLLKNESPFETWKLEVECMKKNAVYPDFVVTQVIGNSLKGHARNILFTMSSTATSQEIIDKLEGIFGDVACGESIMQDFYTATQNESESVMLWGLR